MRVLSIFMETEFGIKHAERGFHGAADKPG